MKSIKPFFIAALIVTIIAIMIPAVLVFPFSKDETEAKLRDQLPASKKTTMNMSKLEDTSIEVAVLRSASNQVEKLPLEKYIVGVVAAEMPANFELEALKAQALAARTYIINQMLYGGNNNLNGADVTDTVKYQVYTDDAELKKKWGPEYDKNRQKIIKAVLETEGMILAYDNQPILAQFFSTSNGYTENSEDYWKNSYPYLKSVNSPWDRKSPKFLGSKTISVAEFEQKLGVKINNSQKIGTIEKRTSGDRVATVNFGGKRLTGKQIREKLDLRSTDFEWKRKGNSIIITTKGLGHGVGMSQYGANGMAQEGSSYKQIVQHYYQGINIISSDTLVDKIVAQK
ncbi:MULTISPECIES: stage II sporulation protein D [Bacillus]|uniref:stage II sporulation protein D n=1 Tax=Bacillus TaxID=1386 RepID=UPI0002E10064|nr:MULTISPECIES: stage II sporulation protein D [Bacillus]